MPKLLGWGRKKGQDHSYPKLQKKKSVNGVRSSLKSEGIVQHKFLKQNDQKHSKCTFCGVTLTSKNFAAADTGRDERECNECFDKRHIQKVFMPRKFYKKDDVPYPVHREYCKICGYEHKQRPESFCLALRDHKINDPETSRKVVRDILKQNGVDGDRFLKRNDSHTDKCNDCNDNSLTERCICDRESKSKDRFGNPEGTRYDIVRFFRNENRRPKILHRDVSDVVAHLHVNDPRTRKEGVYFDGFRIRH